MKVLGKLSMAIYYSIYIGGHLSSVEALQVGHFEQKNKEKWGRLRQIKQRGQCLRPPLDKEK
jgi:hypothetical protein